MDLRYGIGKEQVRTRAGKIYARATGITALWLYLFPTDPPTVK
jgi:hypothetical protein